MFSEDSPKKHPFPCPTTYRTALLHYVDIASVVKTHVLRELAEYAKDFEHKEFLMNITDTTEEAKVVFFFSHLRMNCNHPLITPYTNSPCCSFYKGNLFNSQDLLFLVIILFILLTLMCDSGVIF